MHIKAYTLNGIKVHTLLGVAMGVFGTVRLVLPPPYPQGRTAGTADVVLDLGVGIPIDETSDSDLAL